MDNFNVINLTSSLEDLENDMINWMNLPLNFRLRADEECIRRYGMTNTELFNTLKSNLINKEPEVDNMDNFLSNVISERAIEYFPVDDDLKQKFEISQSLQMSPSIIIINPLSVEEYGPDELAEKYTRFMALSYSNKVLSNQYSIDLWGYDVPNMYQISRNKLLGIIDDIDSLSYKIEQNKLNTIKREFVEAYMENDRIRLHDIANKCGITCDDRIFSELSNLIDVPETYFSEIVPYFTPSDMAKYATENSAAYLNNIEYPGVLIKKITNYAMNPTDSNKQSLINCGWNPSVPLNRQSVMVARERFINWYKDVRPTIENVTKIKDSKLILNESSVTMDNIYRKKDIYPLFIVLSYSGTFFGKIIRTVKRCEYAHAGIAFNSDMKAISTFKFGKDFKGFNNDNLEVYKGESKDAIIDVICLFVTGETKIKVENAIKQFINNQDKSLYAFGNLFNTVINKKKPNDPENLNLICSQFVDTILKLSKIDISNKSSNLVIPQDFEDYQLKNPKLYKVYEGLARDYNEKRVEDIIYIMMNQLDKKTLVYNESESPYDLAYHPFDDIKPLF